VKRDLAAELLGLGDGAIDLRIDERVGQRQIVVAHELLVLDEVLGSIVVAVAGPDVRAGGDV
jgi:hypothetical protein